MEARSGLTDLVCALKHALSVAIPGSILTFTTDTDAKGYSDGYDFAALSECLDFMVSASHWTGVFPLTSLPTDANDLQLVHEGRRGLLLHSRRRVALHCGRA